MRWTFGAETLLLDDTPGFIPIWFQKFLTKLLCLIKEREINGKMYADYKSLYDAVKTSNFTIRNIRIKWNAQECEK